MMVLISETGYIAEPNAKYQCKVSYLTVVINFKPG